jgi:hypothetical protein
MERDDLWDENDGEELEAEIMRADRPFGSDRRGTTAEEEVTDLSIDDALARERPDVPATDHVVTIEDDGEPDLVGELSGTGSIEQDEFPSPEEAALSVRDEAPGGTDHDDPHPPTPRT